MFAEERPQAKAALQVAPADAELPRLWVASRPIRFPVVADFHMSSAFGTSLQEEASPTIAKTRARGKAF